jgi:peptidase E
MKLQRQIIAMGGLTFDAGDAALLDYVLGQARTMRPRVGYLATAKGDREPFVSNFFALVAPLACEASHLDLFARTPDLDTWLAEQDAIVVAGGNTKSMLAVWQDWGLPQRLRRAWEAGVVLAGWSAGAICWFEAGVTDAWAGRLEPLPGLGFLAGSCCPHYDGEPERRPAYQDMLASGAIAPGIAIDDGAAVHFVNAAPARVVTSRDGADAYALTADPSGVREDALAAERVRLAAT